MTEKSWVDLLSEHSPELAELNRQDGAFLESDGALPAWVKLLMAMQIDAVFNHPGGVRYYGKRARQLGATTEQVAEAIQVLRMFAGRPAMVTGVEGLRDE
jgi:alkylhydroperoxidase/carboxymuconolactone decarboxylase family protein YurZ